MNTFSVLSTFYTGFDVTFNVGPCYVTVTSFPSWKFLKDNQFKNDLNPLIPAAFFFHFDMKQQTYDLMFRVFQNRIGNIPLAIGSDQETVSILE